MFDRSPPADSAAELGLPSHDRSALGVLVQAVLTIGFSAGWLSLFLFAVLHRGPVQRDAGAAGAGGRERESVAWSSPAATPGRALIFVVDTAEQSSRLRAALEQENYVRALSEEVLRSAEIVVVQPADRAGVLQALFDDGSFVLPSGTLMPLIVQLGLWPNSAPSPAQQ